ncbi:MAG: hypothetical protein M3Z20_21385, partial [Chloroflexota bacterium]|nr:hypothetical protein [Chloroflexota bacterium]
DFNIKAVDGPETRWKGYVKYKRVSCALWELKEVRVWLAKPPSKPTWFQGVSYNRVSYAGGFGYLYSKHCHSMVYGQVEGWSDPWWQFKARGRMVVETIDEHHLALSQSCVLEAGTTYDSGDFRLPGGTS